MATIEFTGNYEDLSTDKGYQFKFFCEKCGNGYMSSFKPSKLGMATSALQAAGNIFGGILGRAAHGAYEVQRAVGGPAHDAALKEAVAEIKPLFVQCTRCGKWICEPVCFNRKAGLCEGCAPDLDEEMAVGPGRGRPGAGAPEGPRGRLDEAARRGDGHGRRLPPLRREDPGRQVLRRLREGPLGEEEVRHLRHRGGREPEVLPRVRRPVRLRAPPR